MPSAAQPGVQLISTPGIVLILVVLALILAASLQPRVREWLKSHASAVWVAFLVIVGFALVSWSSQLAAGQEKLSAWINTLGQAILTTGFIAVFLSLPDTANFLAKIAGSLLSSGELFKVLGKDAKTQLIGDLLRDRACEHVTKLHAPLFDHLSKLVDSYLAGPYATSYRFTVHIAECENEHGMVLSHAVLRYRLHVKHLKSDTFNFPLRYSFQWEVAPNFADDLDSLIRKFRIKVGSEEFDASALERKVEKLPDGTRVRACFDKKFELVEDTDILVETKTLSDPNDPAEMFFVRYPTRGFSAQLRNDSACRFDYGIFSPIQTGLDSMNRGDPTEGPGNIEISTSDWILPGCGLSITFVCDAKAIQQTVGSAPVEALPLTKQTLPAVNE